jgi:hypothetical protein
MSKCVKGVVVDCNKAFLRYHDPANWPMLREALTAWGVPI